LLVEKLERDDCCHEEKECINEKKFKEFCNDLSNRVDDDGHILVCFAEEGENFYYGDTT
jgi:hypothetical protein